MKALVTYVENIFEPQKRRREFVDSGRPIREYIPERWRDSNVKVSVGGQVLTGDELDAPLLDGESLLVYTSPTGGILETILISLLVSAVLTGVTYGIQALTAPSVRSRRREQEESPTYGFDGIVSTVRPGTPKQVVYGTHRVGGHIVQQFLRPSSDSPTSPAEAKVGELNTLLECGFGPISGISDVKINGNPASDFQGVTIETRNGALRQSPIRGFERIVTQRSKDVLLSKQNGAQVFTTGAECDEIDAIVRFAQGLFRLTTSGRTDDLSVQIRIEYREAGKGAFVILRDQTISAASRSPVDFWLSTGPLPGRAIWELRLTRLTEDDTKPQNSSLATVIAVNEVLDEALSYPRQSLAAVRQLPTNQVSGAAPSYSFLIKGRIVRIYSSTTVYVEEWSDNPAWIWLDFATSTLYGCGDRIKATTRLINSCIAWAAECDRLVQRDSTGVLEKAYRCDIVIDGTISSFDALKAIAAAGRATFRKSGSDWSIQFLGPGSPLQFFSMGRIHRDTFAVGFPRKSETASRVQGQFANLDLDYETDFLPKSDPTLPPDAREVQVAVNLQGVTRVSQVNRLLTHILLANRLERRRIEFEVGVEAVNLEAGDLFVFSHDVPQWGISGRIEAVDSNGARLTFSREVTIESGKTYEITVIHDDDKIDIVPVLGPLGTGRVVNVTPTWSTPITVGRDFAFGETKESTLTFRALSVTRGSRPNRRRIIGREYQAAVYVLDLNVPTPASITRFADPSRIPSPVTNLSAVEVVEFVPDGSIRISIDVFYTPPPEPGALSLAFSRTLGSTIWEPAGEPTTTGRQRVSPVDSPDVTYEISVIPVARDGTRGHPDTGQRTQVTTRGSSRRPPKVTGFTVDRSVAGLVFTWLPVDPVETPDLAYYELRVGATWDVASLIGRTASTNFETTIFSKGLQTYQVKAVNRSGVESFEAAVIVTNVAGRIGENIVVTRQEATAWTGVKSHFDVVSGDLVLDTEDAVVGWRANNQGAHPGRTAILPGGHGAGFRTSGTYTTTPIQIFTTNPARVLVTVTPVILQVDSGAYWTAAGVGDKSWVSAYGQSRAWAVAPSGRVKYRIEMRFSTSGSSEADFGPWQERASQIEVTAKWAQARLTIEVTDPAFTAKVDSLEIIFDVPDVIDTGTVQTSATGTVAVTFKKAYNSAPQITGSIINANTGDEYFITVPTATGFEIAVRNSVGNLVARTFNWVAAGY